MAYKQPRVPQMREGTNLAAFMREIVLFLKDFAMETWTTVRSHDEEIRKLRAQIEEMNKTSE